MPTSRRFLQVVGAALFLFLTATVSSWADRIVVFAGGGTKDQDGVPATEAMLKEPFGITFDSDGNAFIIEMEKGQRLRKVDPNGVINTVAGTGQKGAGGDGGPARLAQFNGAHHIDIAPNDDLYIADTWNCVVRKVDARTQQISRVAGVGEKGFEGDGGSALSAKLGGIYCVALDPRGTVAYLADLPNLRVRAVDLRTGQIRTVAGNGQKGIPDDGAEATAAPLVDPRAVAADRSGNIYILERSGNALRVVGPDGRIRTVVNRGGKKGADGDGGEGLLATMNGPKHLCVDGDNNVIIADAENHLVRRYEPRTRRIVRVAGTGTKGMGGIGGRPELAELNRPHGVYSHAGGTLFIVDSYNDRVLKIVRER